MMSGRGCGANWHRLIRLGGACNPSGVERAKHADKSGVSFLTTGTLIEWVL